MADRTQNDIRDWVLEHLGVKAAGVAASGDDNDLATRVIESVYAQLRKSGLVPFAISAFPDWAQKPFVKVAASHLADEFGIGGEQLQRLLLGRREGRRELAVQVEGETSPTPVRTFYY